MSVIAKVSEVEFTFADEKYYLSYYPDTDAFYIARGTATDAPDFYGDGLWIPKPVLNAMVHSLGLLGDNVNVGYDIEAPKTDEVPF